MSVFPLPEVSYSDNSRQIWTRLDTSFARIFASVYGLDCSEVAMKKSVILTPAHIERLKSGVLPDREVPGLSIIVSSPARKQWRFKRTVAGTKTAVELILGQFPDFSIDEAREWAAPLSKAVARGEDPRETKRAEEAKKMTVASAHAIYLAAMHRGDRKKLKPRTLADKNVIYTRDICPRVGTKILSELTEDDCWDAVYDKAKASKHRANKMAGELSCFLKWCSGREGRMAGIMLKAHPAPTLNSNWFNTGPKANTRFLSDIEIGWLFRALVQEELVYRRGFILLLLTAARRSELYEAPADEFVDGIWTLPANRSKNNEENVVALGPWGRNLAQTNHAWLFPSDRVGGPQRFGWFKARDRIHTRMEEFAGASIARWHFHDLRRTFRSNARRVGIERDIAELMLNHKRKGIEGIYNKNQELELRAAGFAAWENFLLTIAHTTGSATGLMAPVPRRAALSPRSRAAP